MLIVKGKKRVIQLSVHKVGQVHKKKRNTS